MWVSSITEGGLVVPSRADVDAWRSGKRSEYISLRMLNGSSVRPGKARSCITDIANIKKRKVEAHWGIIEIVAMITWCLESLKDDSKIKANIIEKSSQHPGKKIPRSCYIYPRISFKTLFKRTYKRVARRP